MRRGEWIGRLRRALRMGLWMLAVSLGWLPPGASAGVLQIDQRDAIPVWPAVTLRHDPAHELTAGQVLAQPQTFAPHVGTPANLGRMPDTVWLRLGVHVPGGDAQARVLQIDYPPLDRVEVVLAVAGRVVHSAVVGSSLNHDQRPLHARSLAVPLDLPPGDSELLLRVQTRSSMVLPMTLLKPAAFAARESRAQLLHGLVIGLTLAMLLYSVAHGLALRDGMFGLYALMLAGNAVFFMSYFGILAQHVWPQSPQLAQEVSPQAVLVAVFAGAGFMSRALMVHEVSRWAARALLAIGLAAVAGLVAYWLGLMNFRTLQGMATVFGLLPTSVALPVAVVRLLRGDRIAAYMVLGWSLFLVGTFALVGTILGRFEPGFWTLHLYPMATMCEMAVWMAVLGLRVQAIRRNAERASIESDALRSLALTDALTGLPNRRGLHEHLVRGLQGCTPQQLLAVYLIDLDGFKPVNDRYGHDVGDALLVAVGQRLKQELRGSDVVSRLGGDEFVVLATGLPDTAAAEALGRKMLSTAQRPFDLAGHRCEVGLTIGYALAPLHGTSAEDLLKRADAAMYAGKQAGRERDERFGALVAAG